MGQRVLRELVGFSGGVSRYVRDPLGAIERVAIGEDALSNVFAFERDALGRETQRSFAGFVLGQRYDKAGQLVAQSAGARHGASLGRSTLGWTVPSGDGVTRRDGIQRRYEYELAFAPTRIDDGLWGELRFDYDDNGLCAASLHLR